MKPDTVTIVNTDFTKASHRAGYKHLMTFYSSGITGGGTPISEDVFENVFQEIPKREDALFLLLFVGEQPAAIANCFEGFSTFKGKPLLNIHDFAVDVRFQGSGLAKMLLDEIEKIALDRGCCKITLEVLEGNVRAKKVYIANGFTGYELDEKMGKALFWEKPLTD